MPAVRMEREVPRPGPGLAVDAGFRTFAQRAVLTEAVDERRVQPEVGDEQFAGDRVKEDLVGVRAGLADQVGARPLVLDVLDHGAHRPSASLAKADTDPVR